jgi:hypothetical protein
VKNGVPFDVAFSLSLIERRGFVVAFGEMQGARYDWDKLSWEA